MNLKDSAFSGSREQVIAEEAFLPILEEALAELLLRRDQVRDGAGREWSRQFVSLLIRAVHNVRTVLNDYDAQENRTYSYLMELVAGIRSFSHVVYVLKHLRERYLRSPLRDDGPEGEKFLLDTMQTLAWCGNTLRALFAALDAECENLGVRMPEPAPLSGNDALAGPGVRQHLPHNIGEEEFGEEGEEIAQVASSFLRFAEKVRELPFQNLAGYGELREFVRRKLDEQRARRLESFVHAIQSKYDTYVQHTPSESRDPDLRRLRSSISLVLHLLEVTTHLIHFYERHENDIRSERTKERMARIVDKLTVLDRAVHYAFRSAAWLAFDAEAVAQRMIPAYTSVQEMTFAIPESVRLHIRPAALIAAIVSHHGTPVKMKMAGSECDASSVTEVIFLAGTNFDVREVTFRGDERPLADLKILFRIGLEDEGRFELEAALPYLNHRV